MIVDDHAIFRSGLKADLDPGIVVAGEAGTVEEAITVIAAQRPDVVLLDVQLPDVDGFRVAEALTDDPPSPAVVLVSSRSGGDYGRRLTTSPARGFIPKADLSGAGLQRVLDGLAS